IFSLGNTFPSGLGWSPLSGLGWSPKGRFGCDGRPHPKEPWGGPASGGRDASMNQVGLDDGSRIPLKTTGQWEYLPPFGLCRCSRPALTARFSARRIASSDLEKNLAMLAIE